MVNRYSSLIRAITLVIALFLSGAAAAAEAPAVAPATLPPIALAPKPADAVKERRARTQPTVPDGAREIPFVETVPEPALTDAEKSRGYMLFARPSVEPVYPNTRPRPDERLESLVAFAAPGQFQPVTLAIYPVRALANLKVRVSPLTCAAGEISADRVDVRLATYWNVGYPSYTTVKTYRRTPELLERVTVQSSPAGECQRYWLTIHVPEDAKPGLYQGTVSVWDDGFDQAVSVPIALKALGFHLVKDPAKHYSAYYYVRNQSFYKGRSEEFIRKAADNDYRTMAEFGLDMLPTLYLDCPDGREITVRHADEIDRMLAAGLKGPAPVTTDGVIGRIYRDTTPGGKVGSHWKISEMPPPAFYERVTELFRAFEAQRKAKGWPEFIYCPMDEVDTSCKEFGVKVYAAVKAAGVRTYATKDPVSPDAAAYAPYLDIWCSQPYSIPYERIVAQKRHEYWCYPNHDAGEIKDRLTMCKGGRMTYGFGFWRSGYTTLIPWDWNWTCAPDPFDYLRGSSSGCGQRMDDEGEVIPAVYWACFREGYDDARYLYTLQQAVAERQDATDPVCRAAVREARKTLGETWNAIRVQNKYLATGMWPSEDFDVLRWRLAARTEQLLRFPAAKKTTAPSVLIDAAAAPTKPSPAAEAFDDAAKAGKLDVFDLGGDWKSWINGTAEGKIDITADAAGPKGASGLRWTVTIDWQRDGGEGGGKYPIGWPRIARSFKPGQLDLSGYESLVFRVRVGASRDAASAHHTPVGLVIRSHAVDRTLYEKGLDLDGRQGEWITVRLSLPEMIAAAGAGVAPWKSISTVQLFLSESDYPDGTRLVFDLGEAAAQRLRDPAIVACDAPRVMLLPRRSLALSFDIAGMAAVSKGSHTLKAVLAPAQSAAGTVSAQARQDLAAGNRLTLALPSLEPGKYFLRATIEDAKGRQCSQWSRPIVAEAGPLE